MRTLLYLAIVSCISCSDSSGTAKADVEAAQAADTRSLTTVENHITVKEVFISRCYVDPSFVDGRISQTHFFDRAVGSTKWNGKAIASYTHGYLEKQKILLIILNAEGSIIERVVERVEPRTVDFEGHFKYYPIDGDTPPSALERAEAIRRLKFHFEKWRGARDLHQCPPNQ